MTDAVMTASKLVAELEALIDQHGDCVVTLNGNDHETVGEVRAYDADGMFRGRVVEFSLFS